MLDPTLLSALKQATTLDAMATCLGDGMNYGVLSLLDLIENDTHYASQVADKSYYHDNGFLKIVLLSSELGGHELRLHLWGPGSVLPSNIHNHARDFASRVLYGELLERLFVETPAGGTDYNKYRAGSRSDSGVYFLTATGISQLILLHESKVRAGQVYTRRFQSVHQLIIPTNQPVLTLFLQGPRRQIETQVFSNRILESGRISCPAMHPQQLLEHVRYIRGILRTAIKPVN